jgi:hypothetical protein
MGAFAPFYPVFGQLPGDEEGGRRKHCDQSALACAGFCCVALYGRQGREKLFWRLEALHKNPDREHMVEFKKLYARCHATKGIFV